MSKADGKTPAWFKGWHDYETCVRVCPFTSEQMVADWRRGWKAGWENHDRLGNPLDQPLGAKEER